MLACFVQPCDWLSCAAPLLQAAFGCHAQTDCHPSAGGNRDRGHWRTRASTVSCALASCALVSCSDSSAGCALASCALASHASHRTWRSSLLRRLKCTASQGGLWRSGGQGGPWRFSSQGGFWFPGSLRSLQLGDHGGCHSPHRFFDMLARSVRPPFKSRAIKGNDQQLMALAF